MSRWNLFLVGTISSNLIVNIDSQWWWMSWKLGHSTTLSLIPSHSQWIRINTRIQWTLNTCNKYPLPNSIVISLILNSFKFTNCHRNNNNDTLKFSMTYFGVFYFYFWFCTNLLFLFSSLFLEIIFHRISCRAILVCLTFPLHSEDFDEQFDTIRVRYTDNILSFSSLLLNKVCLVDVKPFEMNFRQQTKLGIHDE